MNDAGDEFDGRGKARRAADGGGQAAADLVLILMSHGVEATVGDVMSVPFPRPRAQAALPAHPADHAAGAT